MISKTIADVFAGSKTVMYSKDVPIGQKQLLLVNRSRIAVHFYFTTADYFVSPGRDLSTLPVGCLVNVNHDQHFTIYEHGDSITEAWFSTAVAGSTIGIIEVIANCPCPTGH